MSWSCSFWGPGPEKGEMYRDHGQHLAKNSGHAWSSWHKIGLHMASREQAWASVSSVYVGPQKNTQRPQKEPRRPQKEPRRPQKEPRRPQQSVSKREQAWAMHFDVPAYRMVFRIFDHHIYLLLGFLGVTQIYSARYSSAFSAKYLFRSSRLGPCFLRSLDF